MELVLSALHLAGPGGVQSYLLTVAPHLERLGHEITLYAPEQGAIAELACERGLRVAPGEEALPDRCDGVLAGDGVTALALAGRYPDAARAIVVHGPELDLHLPPQLDGVASAAVAMNRATEDRVRATAAPVEVVRLRQPIETGYLRPAGAARERPRRVLLLGNYLEGARRDGIARACAAAGLECVQVGVHGRPLLEPAGEIAGADIVVGQGRSVLEAMACGRAAWVFGPGAGDGWVTAESYPALEADGFRGTATDSMPDGHSFLSALGDYRASMGEVNRSLVVRHHSAYDHAIELAGLLTRLAPGRPPRDAPLKELARLTRVVYEEQMRAARLARDLREVHEANARLERRLDELTSTLRWRAASLAARPLELARRLARRA